MGEAPVASASAWLLLSPWPQGQEEMASEDQQGKKCI